MDSYSIIRTYFAGSTLGVVLENRWGTRFARLIGGTKATAEQRVAAAFAESDQVGTGVVKETVEYPVSVNGRTWCEGVCLGTWEPASWSQVMASGVKKYRRELNRRVREAKARQVVAIRPARRSSCDCSGWMSELMSFGYAVGERAECDRCGRVAYAA